MCQQKHIYHTAANSLLPKVGSVVLYKIDLSFLETGLYDN